MDHESLRDIRLKISAGTASPEEVKIWEAWVSRIRNSSQHSISEQDLELWMKIWEDQLEWSRFLKKHNLPANTHKESEFKSEDGLAIWRTQSTSSAETTNLSPMDNPVVIVRAALIINIIVVLTTPVYYDATVPVAEPIQDSIPQVDYIERYNPPESGPLSVSLPDKTKVLLNANSGIRYKKDFLSDNREVEIYGEAFLDIAADKKRPFRITTQRSLVRILGTRFNLSAFPADSTETLTLLNGSVMLQNKKSKEERQLTPKEECTISGENITVERITDLRSVLAWKSDKFYFDNVPIKQLLKQIEKYYGVTIIIDDQIENNKFTIMAERSVKLGELLNGLEAAGGLQYHPKLRIILPGQSLKVYKHDGQFSPGGWNAFDLKFTTD